MATDPKSFYGGFGNLYEYAGSNPQTYLDLSGAERQASYLTTGTTFDHTLHSAIMISDSDTGLEIVFSHGGAASGVNNLQDYLRAYDPHTNPTTAYPLRLNPAEAEDLYYRLTYDFATGARGRYDFLNNNCAQYATKMVTDVASPSLFFELSEALTKMDQAPLVFTHQALRQLDARGLLGSPWTLAGE